MNTNRLLIFGVVGAASCSSPTGLDINRDFNAVTPAATEVRSIAAGSLFGVELRLVDSLFPFADLDRVPVTVRGRGGELETALARPRVCEEPDFGNVACGRVQFGLDTPDRVPQIRDRLLQVGASIFFVLGGGESIDAYFPFGTLTDLLRAVGDWPGTTFVEPAILLPGAAVPPEGSAATPTAINLFIAGFMPIDDADVVPGDDVLQARVGDVLTIEYAPPGQSPLTIEVTVR